MILQDRVVTRILRIRYREKWLNCMALEMRREKFAISSKVCRVGKNCWCSLILDCAETRGVCGLKIEEKSLECTKRDIFREVIWLRVGHNDCWQ